MVEAGSDNCFHFGPPTELPSKVLAKRGKPASLEVRPKSDDCSLRGSSSKLRQNFTQVNATDVSMVETNTEDSKLMSSSASQAKGKCDLFPLRTGSGDVLNSRTSSKESTSPKILGALQSVSSFVATFSFKRKNMGLPDERPPEVLRGIFDALSCGMDHIPGRALDLFLSGPRHQATLPPTCEETIRLFNAECGRPAQERCLDFPGFLDLLKRDDIDVLMPRNMAVKIRKIRCAVANDNINQVVSRISHVGTRDLNFEEDSGTKWYIAAIDPVAFSMILLNALVIGVSCDYWKDWPGWVWVDHGFTAFFLLELLVKIKNQSVRKYFWGQDWKWNIADFLMLLLALFDSLLIIVVNASDSLQPFKLMRLVQLARITRLVRLLRFKFFKELLLLVNGVLAGFRTLLWAIILLGFIIFFLGVLMRRSLGEWCIEGTLATNEKLCHGPHLKTYGEKMFSSIGLSCLTVFRCFTDGCSSPDGTPLMLHIYSDIEYGPYIVLAYAMCFLFVTFGLFNLIMAIFVENTMTLAKLDERKRHKLRHLHEVYVARKLKKLVMKVCLQHNNDGANVSKSSDDVFNTPTGCVPVGLNLQITRDGFAKAMADSKVEELLEDLGISVVDYMDLFDALDADGSGTLDVYELAEGFMKLRGQAEKSDIVAAVLAIRSLQKSMTQLENVVLTNKRLLSEQATVKSTLSGFDAVSHQIE